MITTRRRTTPARARLIGDVRDGHRPCPLCGHQQPSPAYRRLAQVMAEPEPVGPPALLAYLDRLAAAAHDLKHGDTDRLDQRT